MGWRGVQEDESPGDRLLRMQETLKEALDLQARGHAIAPRLNGGFWRSDPPVGCGFRSFLFFLRDGRANRWCPREVLNG